MTSDGADSNLNRVKIYFELKSLDVATFVLTSFFSIIYPSVDIGFSVISVLDITGMRRQDNKAVSVARADVGGHWQRGVRLGRVWKQLRVQERLPPTRQGMQVWLNVAIISTRKRTYDIHWVNCVLRLDYEIVTYEIITLADGSGRCCTSFHWKTRRSSCFSSRAATECRYRVWGTSKWVYSFVFILFLMNNQPYRTISERYLMQNLFHYLIDNPLTSLILILRASK